MFSKKKKHVSETESVSIFSKMKVAPALLGPSITGPLANFILLEDGNRSSFQNIVFLRKHWMMDEVQKTDSFK
jgi:hypothetical protein